MNIGLLIICLLCLAGGFVGGVYFEKSRQPEPVDYEEDVDERH